MQDCLNGYGLFNGEGNGGGGGWEGGGGNGGGNSDRWGGGGAATGAKGGNGDWNQRKLRNSAKESVQTWGGGGRGNADVGGTNGTWDGVVNDLGSFLADCLSGYGLFPDDATGNAQRGTQGGGSGVGVWN